MARRTDRQRRRHVLHQSGLTPARRGLDVTPRLVVEKDEAEKLMGMDHEQAVKWGGQFYAALVDLLSGIMESYPKAVNAPEHLKEHVQRAILVENLWRREMGLEYHEEVLAGYDAAIEQWNKDYAEHQALDDLSEEEGS
jgi:hypothetical protein